MTIALRELIRRPGRFVAAGGALTLLVVLLLVLGAFLDGLTLNATGTLRAQDAELVAFSDTARRSLFRSRVDATTAETIAGLDEVDSVTGLGINQVIATTPGGDVVDVAVVGYQQATSRVPAPPEPGEAIVDARLQEVADVGVGDTLALGRGQAPATIVGFVSDTAFQQQPSVWADPATWREVMAANVAGSALPTGVFQAALVEVADDAQPGAVAEAVDAATGATDTVTRQTAILALPGVQQQQRTFTGIIAVTFAVAALVVALFFALITLERVRLYAVLEALGARPRELLAGVAAQAVGVAAGAIVVGGVVAVGFVALVPADIPVRLEPVRMAQIAGGTMITALVGSLASLRRILRIDPAQAIG
jgi:putative ABC transport system permease protein